MAHEEYKALARVELTEMLNAKFQTKPMLHQLVSMVWALDLDRRRIMLWHDIGTGKTLIALYTLSLWNCHRILVVCPNSVIRSWEEQIELHTKDTYEVLKGPQQVRCDKLRYGKQKLFIVNYEGLQVLFSDKVKTAKGGTTHLPSQQKVRQAGFDAVVFDESHHLLDARTIKTRISGLLSRSVRYAICMTGTPIQTDELDLWSQYHVLNHGTSLGTNYFAFRGAYCGQGKFRWYVKKDKRPKILERIAPVTLRYEVHECLDLPELVVEPRHVELTPYQRRLYQQVLKGLAIELAEGKLPPQTIELRAMKLIQIASGFIIHTDKTTERFAKKHNAKLAELRETLIQTARQGTKVIVVHGFQEEGRIIEDLCRDLKIKFRSLRGEIKNKDKSYADFKEDPSVKVLIIHPKSGGEGLNFQGVCHLMIFYSHRFLGTIGRQQCIGRIHRAGQTLSCTIIDILASDTLDEPLYANILERVNITQTILNYIAHAQTTTSS